MRIGFVIHDYDPHYGQGRYTIELAERFARDHVVYIFANTFRVPIREGLIYRRIPGIRCNAITTIFSFLIGSLPILRRVQLDILHIQGLSAWKGDLVTAHICNAEKYRRLHDPSKRLSLFSRIIIPLEDSFFRSTNARCLIAVSKSFASDIVQHYGWRKPIEVIHHGTDFEQFHPPESRQVRIELKKEFGLPSSSWVWLFIGEAMKGLREVIETLVHFPRAHLLVVTRSNPRNFIDLARRCRVHSRIIFHGPLEPSVKAYQASDVLVYPSDYDPFGLVVTEAMACGLPVVVGRRIGAAELVQDRINGLLCDPERGVSIRESLRLLEDSPEIQRELGCQARQTILDYSWNRCAEKTMEVYRKLIAAKEKEVQ